VPRLLPASLALAALAAATAAGCGIGGPVGAGKGPSVVVTTTILGDVTRHLVGDDAEVTVLMPPNADPHDFQASARQAAEMREARALVVNGGGFEAGLDDTIAGAHDDGVATFTALDHVSTRRQGGHVDPHFFTDPARMATAAEALAGFLADEVPGLDTAAFRRRAAAYVADLRALDRSTEQTLAAVPADRRKLVTNHDVFGYFASHYGFEVLGAVIPSATTQAQPSAGDLAGLAHTVRRAGVPAVFADTSSPERLADALAQEVGDEVKVVDLYSESLGPPGSPGDSYVGMVRTNARRIAAALGDGGSP
jgi:zinc/manganese transport system substrate-binding protein